MTVIPTVGSHPKARHQPLRRTRKGQEGPEGAGESIPPPGAHGVRIPIRLPSSSNLQPALNISGAVARVLPLALQWIPYWILVTLGKEKDENLRPWCNVIGPLLALCALIPLLFRLPELKGVFSLRQPSVAICMASVALFATLVWNEVSGDYSDIRDELLAPELSKNVDSSLDIAVSWTMRIASFVGAALVVPSAQELALRSWLYRETVFMLSMAKEEESKWAQFDSVPFSSWDWFPALQTSAAMGMLHSSTWGTSFASAYVFQIAASWRGSFVDALHAHWLYSGVISAWTLSRMYI